LVALLDLPSIL